MVEAVNPVLVFLVSLHTREADFIFSADKRKRNAYRRDQKAILEGEKFVIDLTAEK